MAVDPEGDPLGLYIRSLGEIRSKIPADALVLPGHQLPFHGLHMRMDQLVAHHQTHCAAIAAACAPRAPLGCGASASDPPRARSASDELRLQRGAGHVNYMLRRGELVWFEGSDEVERVMARG